MLRRIQRSCLQRAPDALLERPEPLTPCPLVQIGIGERRLRPPPHREACRCSPGSRPRASHQRARKVGQADLPGCARAAARAPPLVAVEIAMVAGAARRSRRISETTTTLATGEKSLVSPYEAHDPALPHGTAYAGTRECRGGMVPHDVLTGPASGPRATGSKPRKDEIPLSIKRLDVEAYGGGVTRWVASRGALIARRTGGRSTVDPARLAAGGGAAALKTHAAHS